MKPKSCPFPKAEYAAILEHLEASIAILEKNRSLLGIAELQIKSMLAVVRRELVKREMEATTGSDSLFAGDPT